VEPDIFSSPAVGLFAELADAGLVFEATQDGRLRVRPAGLVTPERAELIRTHRDHLLTLARICDEGVQRRAAKFRTDVEATRDRLPAFLYRACVPYVAGVCFSCGDRLNATGFGRCWRCALAWRLAVRVPITATVAEVLDQAREA
jgi:hypothetical protein